MRKHTISPIRILLSLSFLLIASTAWADEIPIGGRQSDLEPRFNKAALDAGLQVRLRSAPCQADGVICPVAFNGRDFGHASRVEGEDLLKTFLLIHSCNQEDGLMLAEAARVLVTLLGARRRVSEQAYQDIANSISGILPANRTGRVIDGIEFVNSRLSCSLFIGRPVSAGDR